MLDDGIAGGRCDATVVLPVFSHLDVAFVAPLFTPAANKEKNKRSDSVKKSSQASKLFFFRVNI